MEKKSISNIIYIIAGIIAGYASFLVDNSFISVGIAIAGMVLVAGALKSALKIEEKFKWFLSNGGWMYFFIWYIAWVMFYTLAFPM